MPGIPTHFKILELTIQKLKASNKPELLKIAQVMEKNRGFAFLGAIGPLLADFLPAYKANSYLEVWQKIFLFVGGDGQNPGFYELMQKTRDYFDKVDAAIAAQDLDALKALDGDTQNMQNEIFPALTEILSKNNLTQYFQDLEKLALKTMPKVMAGQLADPAPLPENWRAREFLFWKKTGKFATALLKGAVDSKDDRFLAYAFGYLTCYAGLVCGSPFINSIVYAPYRLHYWRHRWVNNYVDAWVYGKYESAATMNGDTPSIPYKDWPKLCDADLHKEIEITGGGADPVAVMKAIREGGPLPSDLPDDFVKYWFKSFEDIYGGKPYPPDFSPQTLKDAYQVIWLMLWFQTSGEVLGCNPPPSKLVPPSNCDQPPWADPNAPPGSSSGTSPPPPDPAAFTETDTAKKVTGIILAILGGIAALWGQWTAGGAALAGGIWLATHADEVDWTKLACHLYWVRWSYYDAMEGLIQAFAKGGVIAPDPYFLGAPYNPQDPNSVLAAIKLVKSRVAVDEYPAIWFPIDQPPFFMFDFTVDPKDYHLTQYTDASGATQTYKILVEWLKILNATLKTRGYLNSAYPDFFVDDPNNPMGTSGVRVRGEKWPVRDNIVEPKQFGNAVENAVDLLANLNAEFPDWNLDGDRGLAYFTWIFQSVPRAMPIEIAPEP